MHFLQLKSRKRYQIRRQSIRQTLILRFLLSVCTQFSVDKSVATPDISFYMHTFSIFLTFLICILIQSPFNVWNLALFEGQRQHDVAIAENSVEFFPVWVQGVRCCKYLIRTRQRYCCQTCICKAQQKNKLLSGSSLQLVSFKESKLTIQVGTIFTSGKKPFSYIQHKRKYHSRCVDSEAVGVWMNFDQNPILNATNCLCLHVPTLLEDFSEVFCNNSAAYVPSQAHTCMCIPMSLLVI